MTQRGATQHNASPYARLLSDTEFNSQPEIHSVILISWNLLRNIVFHLRPEDSEANARFYHSCLFEVLMHKEKRWYKAKNVNKHADLEFLFTLKAEIDSDGMTKKGLSVRFSCTFGFSNIRFIYFSKQSNSSGKFTVFCVFHQGRYSIMYSWCSCLG